MGDLRDRIAAAMQQADRQMALKDEMPVGVYYSRLAHAVIAELGLRPDRVGTLMRWVTEWVPDE